MSYFDNITLVLYNLARRFVNSFFLKFFVKSQLICKQIKTLQFNGINSVDFGYFQQTAFSCIFV